MNNSLHRILDGMIATVKTEIIPRLDDEFARGQAYGVIDLLNNLKPRIDWLVTPLYEEVCDQNELIAALKIIFTNELNRLPAFSERGKIFPGANASEIEQIRNKLDEQLCVFIDWFSVQSKNFPTEIVTAADDLLKQHLQKQLKREMSLTSRPLFGEIAKG